MDKLTADTVTADQIRRLRKEALAAGDIDMAEICKVAILDPFRADDGDRTAIAFARGKCADAINARAMATDELIPCLSATGWSLHAPGSSDEDIREGNAPPLVSGEGRPTRADHERARAVLAEQGRHR